MKVLPVAAICLSLSTALLAAPSARAADKVMQMQATWYGGKYDGHPMMGGDVCKARGHGNGIFHKSDPTLIAAAVGSFPFGTRLRVENPATGKAIVGMVCDRGSFSAGWLDLSQAGAQSLGFGGIAPVEVTVIK